MIIEAFQPSLRNRIGASLRDDRLALVAEMMVVASIFALRAFGLLPITTTIPLLVVGWLSLWLRRSGWRQIGMARPASWGWIVLLGIGLGVALAALDVVVVLPWLERVADGSLDLRTFDSVRGNLPGLLFYLTATWTLAAFGEEMVYRGYLLNRLADSFGRSKAGWALSVIIMSLLFGLVHDFMGIAGVVFAILDAMLLSALYLASGRNLWLPAITHGVGNTMSFLLLFMGVIP